MVALIYTRILAPLRPNLSPIRGAVNLLTFAIIRNWQHLSMFKRFKRSLKALNNIPTYDTPWTFYFIASVEQRRYKNSIQSKIILILIFPRFFPHRIVGEEAWQFQN